ncbi:MAG: hypothetical protein GOV01_00360 [Candidatus Altiarchaeota archaeon]|nr:hypothetical protein [Candidatus Altiarchaeota archaeon]
MAKKTNDMFPKFMMAAFVVTAFFIGAMAAPKGTGNAGYDDYGYNEKAATFQGCLANYYNWKAGTAATECTDTDLQIHAKWHFNNEGGLDWLLNLFYSPVTGSHVLKRYVTVDQETCTEIGGTWFNFHKVSQTGELVPICQIMEVESGEGATLVATPAGFGLYQRE